MNTLLNQKIANKIYKGEQEISKIFYRDKIVFNANREEPLTSLIIVGENAPLSRYGALLTSSIIKGNFTSWNDFSRYENRTSINPPEILFDKTAVQTGQSGKWIYISNRLNLTDILAYNEITTYKLQFELEYMSYRDDGDTRFLNKVVFGGNLTSPTLTGAGIFELPYATTYTPYIAESQILSDINPVIFGACIQQNHSNTGYLYVRLKNLNIIKVS